MPAERFYQRMQRSASGNRFGPSRREEVDLGPGEREGGRLEIKAGGFEQARGEQTGLMHRERKNVSGPSNSRLRSAAPGPGRGGGSEQQRLRKQVKPRRPQAPEPQMQRLASETLSSLGPGSPQVFCSQREGRTESLTALLNGPGSLLKCWCSGPAPDFSSEGLTQRVLRISTCKRRCLGTEESEVLGAGTEAG